MKLRPEDLTRLQEHFALAYLRARAALNAHRESWPDTTNLSAGDAVAAMGAWFDKTAALERDVTREAEGLASVTTELLLGIEVRDDAAVARVVATYETTGEVRV